MRAPQRVAKRNMICRRRRRESRSCGAETLERLREGRVGHRVDHTQCESRHEHSEIVDGPNLDGRGREVAQIYGKAKHPRGVSELNPCLPGPNNIELW